MRSIAIVHDWLTTYAGSERVLEQIIHIYPEADLFAVCDFIPDSERSFLGDRQPETTFIQKLPFARTRYRSYLPLMPIAIEQFDFSAYDIIISSSHAVAKGVITGPDQLHISYIHSPMRYAWDLQNQYLRESGLDRGVKGWLAKWFLHKIRLWDYRSANGVDYFIANSKFISRRIWKNYRRNSEVIYPPVDVSKFTINSSKGDYFVTASRMAPYKKIDLIVEAFTSMPDERLIVVGDGPDMKKIRKKAGTNIELLGYQEFEVLRDYMRKAKAFIFAAEEDFGIVPVEAQACGTPVIAYGKGGALETVIPLGKEHPTGLFFQDQTVDAIVNSIRDFQKRGGEIKAEDCRRNAERFSVDNFREEFEKLVENKWKNFRKNM